MFRIGFGPGDAYCVDRDFAAEVDHHPLRMARVVFASEGFRQVRITFPVRFQIAVGEPRPAVSVSSAEAAMRKRRCPGMADHLARRFGIADKVALLMLRIAPGPAWVPVPGLDHELGVLAVGNGLPA